MAIPTGNNDLDPIEIAISVQLIRNNMYNLMLGRLQQLIIRIPPQQSGDNDRPERKLETQAENIQRIAEKIDDLAMVVHASKQMLQQLQLFQPFRRSLMGLLDRLRSMLRCFERSLQELERGQQV